MTDAGQGLALKGADEVGGAQEDNTSEIAHMLVEHLIIFYLPTPANALTNFCR